MPIQSKDDAQSKADNRVDRNLFKKKKQDNTPLMQRDFRDLTSLKDQLEWVKLKTIQKDKERYA
jgi:hypothetical protein